MSRSLCWSYFKDSIEALGILSKSREYIIHLGSTCYRGSHDILLFRDAGK